MNDSMIYVLLSLSIILIVIAVILLVLVLNVLKKQKELIEICKTKPVESHATVVQVAGNKENVTQDSNLSAKRQGIIICKKCYAAISETSVACSVCKMPVGRR